MPTPKAIYQIKVTLNPFPAAHLAQNFSGRHDNLIANCTIFCKLSWAGAGYHLHMFTINGQIYGDPEDDEFGGYGNKKRVALQIKSTGWTRGI